MRILSGGVGSFSRVSWIFRLAEHRELIKSLPTFAGLRSLELELKLGGSEEPGMEMDPIRLGASRVGDTTLL